MRMQTKRGLPRDNGRTFVEHCPAVKHDIVNMYRNHTNKHAQWCGYPREHPPRGKPETIRLATEDQVRAHIRDTEKLETVQGNWASRQQTKDLAIDQTPGTEGQRS